MKKHWMLFITFFSINRLLFSGDITITQIDTSSLLSAQTIRLFIDTKLPIDQLRIEEASDGENFLPIQISSVTKQAAKDEGISFLLLLDNSGSMWDDLYGLRTNTASDMRINHAKQAVEDFLSGFSGKDRCGLAVFNTFYTLLIPVHDDSTRVVGTLDSIREPLLSQSYTELYGSLKQALEGFGERGRRRVLVVLSDGEHYPSPALSSDIDLEDAILAAHHEGISCHVINFGLESDQQLKNLALQTGGLVFDTRNGDDLLEAYNSIRERVQSEYALRYRALMLEGDRRYVRVSASGNTDIAPSIRYYFTGSVFGTSTDTLRWYHPLFFFLPLLFWVVILLFRLEHKTDEAQIRLLYGGSSTGTKIFTLRGNKTVVGGDPQADVTILGNPSLAGDAATIVRDEKTGTYTIAASSDLTVNNRPVKSKHLEPGDVINMAGTVVVFDDKDRMPNGRLPKGHLPEEPSPKA